MRILVAALFVLVLAPAAHGQCTTSSTLSAIAGYPNGVVRTGSGPADSASAAWSSCQPEPPICGNGSGGAFYNLVIGYVGASAYGANYGSGSGTVRTNDVFTLSGPPSASPITFTAQAHLILNGYGSCAGGAGGNGGIESDTNGDSLSAGGCTLVIQDLKLPITRAVGSKFNISLFLNASADNSMYFDTSERLSFPDLPPGYGVTSCQGFTTLLVVPALQRSWGSLKTLYR